MAGAIYDNTTLLQVMRFQKQLTPFWLGFFGSQINFETEDILFDRVNTDYRKLAPFVVPNVQGQVHGMTGYDSISFKPAYVKPKYVVDPNMVIPRQPGEALGSGSLSYDQRRDAVIAELTKQMRSMLTNRNEWLAARALIDAQVTISGDNYPARTVDFRRHASLSYTLLTGARWSQSTATPLADLQNARINANNRSGARIKKIVFGGTAWDYFAKHPNVDLKALQDRNFGGINADVQRIYDGYEGQEYMGRISGSMGGGTLELWVDTSKYVDQAGAEQFFLDQKTVVGISEMVEGVRCFGAIKDFDARLQPLEVFMKNWRNEDPSVEYLLGQSAPLMVPKRPNATFKILTSD
jgi:hypothetical protein